MTAFITEKIARKSLLNAELSRKILHIVAGILAAIAPIFITNYWLLIVIVVFAVIATFFLVRLNIFVSLDNLQRKSWGIFFFPLSYLLLIIFFFHTHPWIITISMAILAFSDSAAAIMGEKFSKKYFNLSGDQKSLVGSLTFFFVTILIIISYFNLFDSNYGSNFYSIYNQFLLAFIMGLLLASFEAISSKGTDNLTVPLFSAYLFYLLVLSNDTELLYNFSIGILLSATVAVLSYKLRFLSLSGSVATFILAGFIFGLGGWKWSIPILAFFVLSSVLSKIRNRVNKEVETYFEKSGTRDYMQVIANGGVGGILVIINSIFPDNFNYVIYVASLSAVCADTWATEIGTLRRTKTYNILNLKPIAQGTSGGISILGSIGALLGSAVIALSGIFFIEDGFLNFFILIIATGLFGSFFDSFLGATIQAQFQCTECEKITEKTIHCDNHTHHLKGLKWLNNDFVNLLSSIGGAILIIIIKGIFN